MRCCLDGGDAVVDACCCCCWAGGAGCGGRRCCWLRFALCLDRLCKCCSSRFSRAGVAADGLTRRLVVVVLAVDDALFKDDETWSCVETVLRDSADVEEMIAVDEKASAVLEVLTNNITASVAMAVVDDANLIVLVRGSRSRSVVSVNGEEYVWCLQIVLVSCSCRQFSCVSHTILRDLFADL